MRRTLTVVALAVLVAVLGAFVVRDLPQTRDVSLARSAPGDARIMSVVEDLRAVRKIAVPRRDDKPLSTVEGGAALEIDAGALRIAELLDTDAPALAGRFDLLGTYRPLFSVYPLWFAATVRDVQTKRTFVQVFERSTAADPWLLVASPEVTDAARIPDVRRVRGLVDRVAATDDEGLAVAPDALGDVYVDALTSGAGALAEDAFVVDQRASAQAYANLANVEFDRTWQADPVRHTIRTKDGGALVVLTLRRTDTFEVAAGLSVTWPPESPARAFFAEGISGQGALASAHQLLVHLPGDGAAPRTIGVAGGTTGAD